MVEEAVHHGSILTDTSLWVAISFVVFTLFVFKKAQKALYAKLDTRIIDIKNEIDTAESMRIQAQELLAQYQRKQRDAVQESEDIIENAKRHAREIQRNAEKELEASMARKEIQMQERLKRMEEQAIADMRNQAVEKAMAATRQILAQELAKKKGSDLIDVAIEDLDGQLKKAA